MRNFLNNFAMEQASHSFSQPSEFQSAFCSNTLTTAVETALSRVRQGLSVTDGPVLALRESEVLHDQMRVLMGKTAPAGVFDNDRFARILDLYLATSIDVRSHGYMARQFGPVVAATAAFDMVAAVQPQPASFYEAGQMAVMADRIIAEEFGALLGWQQHDFEMIATSGGALANMTALLAARNRRYADSWRQGLAGLSGKRPAIAVSIDAHYSIERVPGILGLGTDSIVRLPMDSGRRIDVEGARAAIAAAESSGFDVFAIVASAGTTPIGAIDPLAALAELAAAKGIWLHVDGAHSAALLLSDRLRPRLDGIERADSFSLDAHKTLFMPAVCTLLFYRDRATAANAFQQEASYVFDQTDDDYARLESGGRNFECTKRPAILNLWLTWALYGRTLFEERLNRLVELVGQAHTLIDDQRDFVALHQPESNILCFRYQPSHVDAGFIDQLQTTLWGRLRADGHFFLSKVSLDGRMALRMVIMNPAISMTDVAALLEEIRRLGATMPATRIEEAS